MYEYTYSCVQRTMAHNDSKSLQSTEPYDQIILFIHSMYMYICSKSVHNGFSTGCVNKIRTKFNLNFLIHLILAVDFRRRADSRLDQNDM